ncbi:MAG TPA: hypothetical protein VFI90_03060 [Rubrobacter sp.]|nr:hypothetical protein [Rubrobacter sp.]
MKRTVRGLIVPLIATILAVSTMSSAVAEPGKNQIKADASCSNGETYTFVLNGMGKAWQLEDTNSNLLVKNYTLTYYDPRTGALIGSDTYGGGEKNGQEGDLITCEGETITELQGLGLVRVVAVFEAFVTPRGSA